jgi:hypothetical protein
VLSQVDGTLQAIDARVRARLAELERKPNGKSVKKTSSGKAAARSRKVKSALPAIAA